MEGRLSAPREESARMVLGVDIDQLALALAERMKQAQEPKDRPPFGELAHAWLERVGPTRVAPGNDKRLVAHLLPLFLEDEASLTAGMVDDHLASLTSKLSPSTINKVRGAGRSIVADAQARRLWSQPNPFGLVRRMREPQHQYELLDLEELARVQAQLRPDRRRMFRVALHVGLRPGELMALQKNDIDTQRGVLHIHRSHGRDETKTGTTRVVPILDAIAPDVLEAARTSPSTSLLLFPGLDGERQRFDVKLTRTLRYAMAQARVGVVSCAYHCRARGCDYVERRPGSQVEERLCCPTHGNRLLPVPVVRPVRWYDLRHMCATLHHRAGADPLCVSLALGHSVKGTTQSTYTHPSDDMLRRELSRWHLP